MPLMIEPAPELALVGTYSEPGVDWRDQTRLATAAAEGTVAPARKTPSEAAISGRVAAIVLVVLFILTAVVVWIAA